MKKRWISMALAFQVTALAVCCPAAGIKAMAMPDVEGQTRPETIMMTEGMIPETAVITTEEAAIEIEDGAAGSEPKVQTDLSGVETFPAETDESTEAAKEDTTWAGTETGLPGLEEENTSSEAEPSVSGTSEETAQTEEVSLPGLAQETDSTEEETLTDMEEWELLWDQASFFGGELMLRGMALTAEKDSGNYTLEEMKNSAVRYLQGEDGKLCDKDFVKYAGESDTDWDVFALARLGIKEEGNYQAFLAAEGLLKNLKKGTPTEWYRRTLAVLAAGGDPTNVGSVKLNLIKDGADNEVAGEPLEQGLNAVAFALLALDSRGYDDGTKDNENQRGKLIEEILIEQLSTGGWPINAGDGVDSDTTSMVIQALAPYYADGRTYKNNDGGDITVKDAVDKAWKYVMGTTGTDNSSETISQAIIACCALGWDPSGQQTPSGKNLIEKLGEYYDPIKGGFKHDQKNSSSNEKGTNQALHAIAAYERFQEGQTSLYDFRDPAQTDRYVVSAGGGSIPVFVPNEDKSGTVCLPVGVTEIRILNIPVGNYDSAIVRVKDGSDSGAYYSSFRRADGSRPVEGMIPVSNGTELSIEVSCQDGSKKTWTLACQEDPYARIKAVEAQIADLPDVGGLALDNAQKLAEIWEAYKGLDADGEKVVNYETLANARVRMGELLDGDARELRKKQTELAEKVEKLPVPAGVEDKQTIRQYQLELNRLGEWRDKQIHLRSQLELTQPEDWDEAEKQNLLQVLEEGLKRIAERENVAARLDQDIWDGIDPLRVSQKNESEVRRLMTRYSALSGAEQALLENKASLLEAAEVVEALSDGVIPSRVFRNMMSTKEDFTYYGTTRDKFPYMLTFDGDTIKGTKAVDARAEISIGKDKDVAGSVAAVDLAQQGSLNGKAALSFAYTGKEGSYNVYYMNNEKLSVQSAGKANVENGQVSMTLNQGGRYWMADSTVRLNGNTITGSTTTRNTLTQNRGLYASGAARNMAGTVAGRGLSPSAQASGGAEKASSSGSRSGGASGTIRSGSSGKASGQTETSRPVVKASPVNGVVRAIEFAQIAGKDMNLSVEGVITDGVPYTITFNGMDIKESKDFPCTISVDSAYREQIREIADSPVVLSMAETGAFPGKALISINMNAEDADYLLFRYNPETGKAQYVKKVSKQDGALMFTLSQGGEYFMAERVKASALENGEDGNGGQETGNGTGFPDGADDGNGLWNEAGDLMAFGTGEDVKTTEAGVFLPYVMGVLVFLAGIAAGKLPGILKGKEDLLDIE